MAEEKKMIALLWKGYRASVVPKSASATQLSETRQAFYAGASVLFTTLMHVLDNSSDASGMKLLAAIQAEIDEFGQQLDKATTTTQVH